MCGNIEWTSAFAVFHLVRQLMLLMFPLLFFFGVVGSPLCVRLYIFNRGGVVVVAINQDERRKKMAMVRQGKVGGLVRRGLR